MSKYHHSYTFGSSAIFFVRQPSDFNSTLSCARSKKAKSASVCPHPFRVYFPVGSPFGACFSASVKAVDLSLPIECCASWLSIHVGGEATDALGILPIARSGDFLIPHVERR